MSRRRRRHRVGSLSLATARAEPDIYYARPHAAEPTVEPLDAMEPGDGPADTDANPEPPDPKHENVRCADVHGDCETEPPVRSEPSDWFPTPDLRFFANHLVAFLRDHPTKPTQIARSSEVDLFDGLRGRCAMADVTLKFYQDAEKHALELAIESARPTIEEVLAIDSDSLIIDSEGPHTLRLTRSGQLVSSADPEHRRDTPYVPLSPGHYACTLAQAIFAWRVERCIGSLATFVHLHRGALARDNVYGLGAALGNVRDIAIAIMDEGLLPHPQRHSRARTRATGPHGA